MSETPSTETAPLDLSSITRPEAWDRVASDYAEVVAAHLELYSADALKLAEVTTGQRVADVATGPGTLALQATAMAEVKALDFSPQMLDALRRRATPEQLARLELTCGDGQALPWPDAHFDAGFSMFGLFMFPDRARGFAELFRVIRPGGRAVVASWQPQDQIAAFKAAGAELMKEVGATEPRVQPLADPDEFAQEMSAAGFEVEVHDITHTWHSPSLEVFSEGLMRSHVGLGIARDQMSEARYADLARRVRAGMAQALGDGPLEVAMPAWLAVGRRP